MGGTENLCTAGKVSVYTCVGDTDLECLIGKKPVMFGSFPEKQCTLCFTLQCSVKIPKLEMSSKVVQQHSWSLFSVYFRSSRIPPLPDSS